VLRIGEVGLIEIDGVARLRNDVLLLVKARLEIVEIGLCAGDVGLGLIERRDVVPVVNGAGAGSPATTRPTRIAAAQACALSTREMQPAPVAFR
jgi:hypothetical protein